MSACTSIINNLVQQFFQKLDEQINPKQETILDQEFDF